MKKPIVVGVYVLAGLQEFLQLKGKQNPGDAAFEMYHLRGKSYLEKGL